LRETILSSRDALRGLREILFANVVMAGEIPAPTGEEHRLTRFLSDRFREGGLSDISLDQAGNVAAVVPGHAPRNERRHLLVAAHVDKIWPERDDHTVSVGVGEMSGRGIADNALGVAVLASFPLVLEALGIELESDLILLGTTKSFGRGDLGGMRFFLDNSEHDIAAALCLEGIDLGRLSYASLGMARGEITVEGPESGPGPDMATSGVIATLHRLVEALLELNRENYPSTRILIGSAEAVSGFNVPPVNGTIRFEIRSEDAREVAKLEREVLSLARSLDGDGGISVGVEMLAHRRPGALAHDHSLVTSAREALDCLGLAPRVEPSISELAALLDKRIPALTLGITRGSHRHTPRESIQLEPIFDGLAQLASVLRVMDAGEFSW